MPHKYGRYNKASLLTQVNAALGNLPDDIKTDYDEAIQQGTYGTSTNKFSADEPAFLYAEAEDLVSQNIHRLNILVETVALAWDERFGRPAGMSREELGRLIRERVVGETQGKDIFAGASIPLIELSDAQQEQPTRQRAQRSVRSATVDVQPGTRNPTRTLGSPSPHSVHISEADLESHSVKTLRELRRDLRFEEQQKLSITRPSIARWTATLENMLLPLPEAVEVLKGRATLSTQADPSLRVIVWTSLAEDLQKRYYAENSVEQIKTAIGLYEWAKAAIAPNARQLLFSLEKQLLNATWNGRDSPLSTVQRVEQLVTDINGMQVDYVSAKKEYLAYKEALPANVSSLFVATFQLFEAKMDEDGRTLDDLTPTDIATLKRRLHSACHHFRSNNADVQIISADALYVNKDTKVVLRGKQVQGLADCWACGRRGHMVRQCRDAAAVDKWRSTKQRAVGQASIALLEFSDGEEEEGGDGQAHE